MKRSLGSTKLPNPQDFNNKTVSAAPASVSSPRLPTNLPPKLSIKLKPRVFADMCTGSVGFYTGFLGFQQRALVGKGLSRCTRLLTGLSDKCRARDVFLQALKVQVPK